MSRLVTDVHLKVGDKGPFLIGNIRFPGTVHTDNLVIKIYPDDAKARELLQGQLGREDERVFFVVELEPCKDPRSRNR
jgi:hypothetical protein